ncbi:TPA: hypothetical protein HA265_03280 [Candidatus Woesearchaeota archaeon]|nr:hypothetical protein [Candidatus Woesearchaeota archaeon]
MGGRKREVGFQPGDLFEKLRDDLEPFENAHEETLLGEYDVPFEDMVMNKNSKNRWGMGRSKQEKALPFASLPRKAPLKIMYSGGVRGASLVRTVMLIDEAQNFTPYEVMTLLGRLAKGSCAIVCGDTEQLDNPMCTREVNGLTAAISFFLPQHYSLLVNLSENQRHQISEDTTKWKVYSR